MNGTVWTAVDGVFTANSDRNTLVRNQFSAPVLGMTERGEGRGGERAGEGRGERREGRKGRE